MTPSIGQTANRTHRLTRQDVKSFTEATGIPAPSKHEDDPRPRAQSMLCARMVATLLHETMPSDGVYLSQSMKFLGPIYEEDEVQTQIEVVDYGVADRVAKYRATCTNQQGDVVLMGETVIYVPQG